MKEKHLQSVVIIGLLLILIIFTFLIRTRQSRLISEFYRAKPLLAYVDPNTSPATLHFKHSIPFNQNQTMTIDALNIPTIFKFIKYSDENQMRSLLNNYFVDYSIEDIRIDTNNHYCYFRTTDSIWNPTMSKNSFIFKFDIVQRKFVLITEISPKLLPPEQLVPSPNA